MRTAVAVGGAAVLSAAAIGGGLWLAGDDPDVPDSGDVHTAAPGCGVLSDQQVAELLPDAVLESAESGPLSGGENTACTWTSAGAAEDPETLRVDLSARFTDTSGETPVTGDEAAQAGFEAMVPVRGEDVALTGDLPASVWRGQAPGTAELAFHTDNLLVRVSYAGVDQGFDAARDRAVDAAERLREAL
ncbi:hypothetical protein [Nocardiopsis aegyptia]|uniref:hypothetical protein n=1 Tax=Nocardiopsis aegyptia TaxID=220378 RepID=UPI0015C8B3C9|nr:hypothetical protein [Nocardiopsis aegyptia]